MNQWSKGMVYGASTLVVLRLFWPKSVPYVFGSLPMDLGFIAGGFLGAALLRRVFA